MKYIEAIRDFADRRILDRVDIDQVTSRSRVALKESGAYDVISEIRRRKAVEGCLVLEPEEVPNRDGSCVISFSWTPDCVNTSRFKFYSQLNERRIMLGAFPDGEIYVFVSWGRNEMRIVNELAEEEINRGGAHVEKDMISKLSVVDQISLAEAVASQQRIYSPGDFVDKA